MITLRLFCLPIPPPTRHTLFPYTTPSDLVAPWRKKNGRSTSISRCRSRRKRRAHQETHNAPHRRHPERKSRIRSEEHTSELQSLTNLVCRLLLEKKKNVITQIAERPIVRH